MIDAYNNTHDYYFRSRVGDLEIDCYVFFTKEKDWKPDFVGEIYNPLSGALCCEEIEIGNFFNAWNIINGKIDWKADLSISLKEDQMFAKQCEQELARYLKTRIFS